jgi:hypothetical protein
MLELGKILCRNGDIAQRTESGSDSVYWSADVFHLGIQKLTAFYNGSFSFISESKASAFRNNGFDCFNR